ncbi:MAG: hypothetical protein SGCHY_002560 [Lobulomycetales sp.]
MLALHKQVAKLSQSPPVEGIAVLFNEDLSKDIQAEIEGPAGTPFEGGKFRIKLSLPQDFPSVPPKGFFVTKIFHPNVAIPSGEICVSTLKKDWKPSTPLLQLLLTIKCLLIAPNPESALNEEAGKMLLEDYSGYEKYARMMTSVHAAAGSSASKSGQTAPVSENRVNQSNLGKSAAGAKGRKRGIRRL